MVTFSTWHRVWLVWLASHLPIFGYLMSSSIAANFNFLAEVCAKDWLRGNKNLQNDVSPMNNNKQEKMKHGSHSSLVAALLFNMRKGLTFSLCLLPHKWWSSLKHWHWNCPQCTLGAHTNTQIYLRLWDNQWLLYWVYNYLLLREISKILMFIPISFWLQHNY